MGTIYKLIIEDDEGKTTVYPLSHGEISIGRKDGNTIRLMERNVSRRHARLLRNNGTVFIEDLDSYNGIRINGERISGRYEVKEGDLVEIGDYHLALQAAEIADAAQPPPARPATDATGGEWPAAGTVPDFRLPEEILANVRALGPAAQGARPNTAPRDTLIDPGPPGGAAAPPPLVSSARGPGHPPPLGPAANLGDTPPFPGAGQQETPGRALPPFPSQGGLQSGPSSLFPPRGGGVTEEGRPPALKSLPLPAQKRDDLATTPINVGPARISSVSRIVCVTTSYAGREFALTRPELIIGRVEDNDIVIEHRSVSRNHAKIVFDGRAHKIIDLQSANGILVNGEEYAMTDLRRNDLIELGHVKFRFIPAGEPFVPTEEELREMREAGVTPPADAPVMPQRSMEATQPHLGASPAPAPLPKLAALARPHDDVPPHFDPSTAQTVTDTPLSALAMSQALTPQIEPAGATVPAMSAKRPAELALEKPTDRPHERRESPDRAVTRTDTAPRAGSPDQRPTEINIAARPTPAPNGASALGVSLPPRASEPPPATRPNLVEIEGQLDPPKSASRAIVVAVIAVVAAAVVAIVWSMPSGPDGTADSELEALMRAGSYKEAIEHCKSHEYKNPQAAYQMCLEATSRHFGGPGAGGSGGEKDPGGAAAGDPQKVAGAAAGVVGAKDPAAEAAAAAAAAAALAEAERVAREAAEERERKAAAAKGLDKTKAPAVAPAVDKTARAKDLHDRAWRAWTNGDASKAVELLQECVKVANLGKCHRTLGSVYAQIGDTAKSLEHYRKYLAIEPNAPDVARVRDIIRDAENAN